MPIKDQAITVCYRAWNTSTNAPQTGDATNHTLKLVQDGTEAAPTNTPTEVDSTNLPGVYSLALTAGDLNFNNVYLGGKSATANVVLFGGNIPTDRGTIAALPTAAQIATTVWTDTTPGDFTTTSSPGHIIVSQLGLTFTTTGSSVFTVAALANAPTGGSAPTAAQIATAVWTDATASDFTTLGTPGHILQTQLGSAFTTTSSSVFTAASLANAPTGGSAPTAAQIATAVWQDTTAGDFTVAASIGKALYLNAAPGAAGGHFIAGSNAATTVNFTGNLSGSVGSVTGAVGSVTGSVGSVAGAVGSVTGSVGSVTGNVGGNVVGSVASVAGNVGGNVVGSVASVTGAVGSVTGNVGGNVVGSVASVTAAVTVSMSQVLSAPRALDAIADGSITLNDALWSAVCAGAGKEDASSGTSMVVQTPSTGTTLRTFAITTSATNPFGSNFPTKRA